MFATIAVLLLGLPMLICLYFAGILFLEMVFVDEDNKMSFSDYVAKGFHALTYVAIVMLCGLTINFAFGKDIEYEKNALKDRWLAYDHFAVVKNGLVDGVISEREKESFEYFRKEHDVGSIAVVELASSEIDDDVKKAGELYGTLLDEISKRVFRSDNLMEDEKYMESVRLASIASAFEDGVFDANEILLFENEKKVNGLYLTKLEMLSLLGDVESGYVDNVEVVSKYNKLVDDILDKHNFLGGE